MTPAIKDPSPAHYDRPEAHFAAPARYRNSGVMTFIVNHNGTVDQKDLGPNTTQIAERMTAYESDPSWQKVDAKDLQ